MYGPSKSEWLFLIAVWVGISTVLSAIVFICGYGFREVGRVVWKPAAVSCACDDCRCCDACPCKRSADRE